MFYIAQTALELGFLYALVAMALFLSYRVLDIADLTTDAALRFSPLFLHRKDRNSIHSVVLVRVNFHTFRYKNCHNSFAFVYPFHTS